MIWNGLIKELLNIKSEKDLKNSNKKVLWKNCVEKWILWWFAYQTSVTKINFH